MNKKLQMTLKFIMLILTLSGCICAFAHAPADMDIDYNAVSGKLKITVYHKVNSTSVHYIKNVNIYLNRQGLQLEDELIINQKFFSQPIRNEQKALFLIFDLKPGDKLRIVAECNLFGTIEKEFEITEMHWQKLAEQ